MMKRGKMEMVGRCANFHVNVQVLDILKQAVGIVSMVGDRWTTPVPALSSCATSAPPQSNVRGFGRGKRVSWMTHPWT